MNNPVFELTLSYDHERNFDGPYVRIRCERLKVEYRAPSTIVTRALDDIIEPIVDRMLDYEDADLRAHLVIATDEDISGNDRASLEEEIPFLVGWTPHEPHHAWIGKINEIEFNTEPS